MSEEKKFPNEDDENHCTFGDESVDECDCEPPPKCPICGDEAELGGEISLEHFDCNHFVAGWDDGGFRKSPLDRIIIPVLPAELATAEWSSEKLKEVFGEAKPLLAAYGEDFTNQPDEQEFSNALIHLVSDIIEERYYDQPPSARVGWEAQMYFAKEPEAARGRIIELFTKLREGFEVLKNSV